MYYITHCTRRKTLLEAASVAHLTKTIMLESSAGESITNSIGTSKYILAVVQYEAKLNEAKLAAHIVSVCVPPCACCLLGALSVFLQRTVAMSARALCMTPHHVQASPSVVTKKISLRLAPLERFETLTGYTTGALTPCGCKSVLPIVLALPIAQLQPDFFWMGGGEVNLKMGLRVADFICAYSPVVLDIY